MQIAKNDTHCDRACKGAWLDAGKKKYGDERRKYLSAHRTPNDASRSRSHQPSARKRNTNSGAPAATEIFSPNAGLGCSSTQSGMVQRRGKLRRLAAGYRKAKCMHSDEQQIYFPERWVGLFALLCRPLSNVPETKQEAGILNFQKFSQKAQQLPKWATMRDYPIKIVTDSRIE